MYLSCADEVEEPDTIVTDSELVGDLQDLMDSLHIPGTSGLIYIPQEHVKVPAPFAGEEDQYALNLALIEELEDCDDVDEVFHNMQLR